MTKVHIQFEALDKGHASIGMEISVDGHRVMQFIFEESKKHGGRSPCHEDYTLNLDQLWYTKSFNKLQCVTEGGVNIKCELYTRTEHYFEVIDSATSSEAFDNFMHAYEDALIHGHPHQAFDYVY